MAGKQKLTKHGSGVRVLPLRAAVARPERGIRHPAAMLEPRRLWSAMALHSGCARRRQASRAPARSARTVRRRCTARGRSAAPLRRYVSGLLPSKVKPSPTLSGAHWRATKIGLKPAMRETASGPLLHGNGSTSPPLLRDSKRETGLRLCFNIESQMLSLTVQPRAGYRWVNDQI
jgi:hypothetical protein